MKTPANFPMMTWASVTGEVNRTSMVPDRRSSATRRMVMSGATTRKNQKKIVPPKKAWRIDMDDWPGWLR